MMGLISLLSLSKLITTGKFGDRTDVNGEPGLFRGAFIEKKGKVGILSQPADFLDFTKPIWDVDRAFGDQTM